MASKADIKMVGEKVGEEAARQVAELYPRKYHRFECEDYPGVWMEVWYNFPTSHAEKVRRQAQDLTEEEPNPFAGTEFVREWSLVDAVTGEPLPPLGEVTTQLADLPNDLFAWINSTIENAAALARQEQLKNSGKR